MESQSSEYADIQRNCQLELQNLKQEEDQLIQNLNNMLNQRVFLEDKMKGLAKLIPSLKVIKHEAQDLVNTVKDISESSEKISGKIRSLDVARNRVDECQQRVSDLIDLEICSQGVQAAILDSDYETGAAHVHRFLSMDQSLLQRTASDMNNTSNMLKSMRTLQDAADQLRAIVEHKFNEAVNNEDLVSIERFFKIFPLLGIHEEGIKEFCTYLRTKVAIVAEKNLKSAISTSAADKRHTVIYADTLTLLFEGLARIIDTHQPLIETYYGPGRLLSAITVLQKECDIQAKRVLVEWSKTRQINKKIQVINDLSRMSSSSSFSKLEKIDPKDLDILIGEITLMHFRTELYIRFIQRKVMVALNNADSSTEYVEALCAHVLKEIAQGLPNMNSNDRGKLESCLSGLSSVTTHLKDIIDYGIQQLKSTAIKPRINPWVDSFLNVSHHLTEDELSAYEAGESFVQTLIMNLETLLSSFKDILTTSNYDAFTQILTAEVTQRLEKVILKSSFNRLGGLVLDKEVRSLAGYITVTTSWSVRDKFARLTQIATVLNLEEISEIYDYWGNHSGALTWRLTPSELRSVMALRSDFKVEDIRRLKL